MGNLVRSLFPRGKPAAAESRYPNPAYIIPNLVYAVLLSDHNTECEACSFYDRWMWDLAHKIILGACRTHEEVGGWGGGGGKHKQVCTRVDSEGYKKNCFCSARGSNPGMVVGLEVRRSTTGLFPYLK